jgi:hypothetical protein
MGLYGYKSQAREYLENTIEFICKVFASFPKTCNSQIPRVDCNDYLHSNGFYQDSIVEPPCKRQKCSEHFMVIYDIVIKPLLPYVCDQCMGS